ncbi:MAG TPA: very short patch repair endonuclease [Pseudolabrys sp.]|nr:very short patch repair endonuclease [Pseudolabrys sp.]
MEVRRALAQRKTKKVQREGAAGNLPAVALPGETNSPQWDIMSPAKRSALMSRIRGRDTGPERVVRKLLHAMGYRFRLHARDLPGRPDIVLRSRRVAVFVHGCFWHRHDCGLAYTPKTRREFWQRKFDDNVRRDRRTRGELEAAGWRVIIVWECQLDDPAALADRLAKRLGPPGCAHKGASSVTRRKTRRETRDQAKTLRLQRRRVRSL